jgi:TolA-binding protein
LATNPNNKNNAEIYRIQGEIAYKKQDYEKAIGYLKNYEKFVQKFLRADMYLLGLSYYQLKDYNNTVKYLSKATTENDEMTENAYLHLGNAYIKLDDINNARLAYEASLRTNFNKIVREEALFNYALTSYQTTTAFGESVKAFEQLLSEFPRSRYADKAYDYLSSVYMITKNYQAAYQSILKIKKPSAQLVETKQYLLYQLGTEAFTLNKMEEAIKYFSLSLQSSTTGKYSAENLFWRADCYYRTNRSELCIIDLLAFFDNKYAKASSNKVTANYALAYGYFSQKEYTEALEWFLKYTQNESNTKVISYSDALNRIGDCYFIGRDFTNAEKYYQKAAIASPNTADYAIFQGAYVSGLQKKYEEKIAKLEDLIGKYPKSEYADDALYEIGRSYLTMQNDAKAIETYNRLLKAYPSSDLARKSALEIAMIHFNRNNFEQAISAYKNVIAKYPGSEESFTALESLETVYIELNDVPAYLAYTRTLGGSIRVATASREDSLSYIASEKQYMMASYAKAITGMKTYLNKFCAGGRYCTTAQYYLADSYYKTDDKENALKAYQTLLTITGNQYAEEATTRCAEISFDKKDYAVAQKYFKQLEGLAQTTEKRYASKLGILRCSFFLNDHQTTINIATEIINDQQASEALKIESRYNRAKAYLAIKQSALATEDLILLSTNTRSENGAEAKYLLANLYFELNKPSDAENEVMDFAKKNTPYQFWLARSFVLLADIYIKQNNDFQAKQYLLSLKNNYTVEDDIQTLIKERLEKIIQREQQTIIN